MATRSEHPAGTAFAAQSLWMPPFGAAQEYLLDACQRSILFLDVLRQRGNNYREHTARKAPHVLTFQAELILDGRTFERPVNYALVRITPPLRALRSIPQSGRSSWSTRAPATGPASAA